MRELPGGNFLFELIRRLAPDPKAVAAWIEDIRAANPELSNEELAHFVSDKIVWAYTTQGAALALPSAIPGLGTIVQISTEKSTASVGVALMA